MVIEKALIAQISGPQLIQARVEVDWPTKSATCSFLSVNVSDFVHCEGTI